METAKLRSKAIRGLECCTNQDGEGQPLCYVCPYGYGIGVRPDCPDKLMTDALSLLKMDERMEDDLK